MIRNAVEDDHEYIIARLNHWWGGRDMSAMLPRLFFQHFNNSSFVFEESDKIMGFLIGFKSQSLEQLGYVHFVGVDPTQRHKHIATALYQAFFDFCKSNHVTKVKCITSPINTASIAFHHRLGFKASSYDVHGNPIPVENYDSPGEARVTFVKNLH